MPFKRWKTSLGVPLRDVAILPAIAALTWIALGTSAEVAARLVYPEQLVDACIVQDGRGNHFQAGCHSRVKTYEGRWVDYGYNDCGYRSDQPCGRDGIRLAILGTSLGHGYWVSYDQSFAGRIEHDLTSACAEPVNILNASLPTSDVGGVPVWHVLANRTQAVLLRKPQALLMVMNSYDLELYKKLPDLQSPPPPAQPAVIPRMDFFHSLQRHAVNVFHTITANSRALLMVRHWTYENRARLVTDHLSLGDEAGYLSQSFQPQWQLRLKVADETIGAIAAQAQAAAVPLLVVLVPRTAQAVLARQPEDAAGTDPFALGRALRQIAQRHNAAFLDLTDRMAGVPDPARLYFLIDGHLNEEGHRLLADAIEQRLMPSVEALSHCRPLQAAPGSVAAR